ncbi:MAG TPA: outer membrane lipoprotein chaperone LolA [Steroidobacter sp.]|nr:outer membrane lipoprotein chaperone LolA [Steroidobacter sp.]
MKFSRSAALLALCAFLTSLTCSAGASSKDVQAGRQKVQTFLNGLDGLQAQFEQVLTDRAGQVVDRASGVLAVRRPNRFRWDYRDPYEQVIVADGERVWLYDPDLEQVTVRKLDESLSATPAMLLSGAGTLDGNFTVTQSQQEDSVFWVRMEPRRDDTDFKWVRLGFEGAALRYMQLGDKLGQTTRLEFRQVERNPPLDPARFTFTAPPGADVIGDASGAQSAVSGR